MHGFSRSAGTAAVLAVLSVVSSADRLRAGPEQRADVQLENSLPVGTPAPSVVVLDSQDVAGVLGKDVRSTADEDMGRIINVIVDRTGQVRAAVIDFGGFLGVGNRKIAVDWNTLNFAPAGDARSYIILELTQDYVRAAPEYKPGKPVVIVEALADPRSPASSNSAAPE